MSKEWGGAVSGLPNVVSALPGEIHDAARDAVHTLQGAAGAAGGTIGDVFGDTVDAVGDALDGKEREIGVGAVVLIAAGLVVGFLVIKSLRSLQVQADGNSAGAAKKAPARRAAAKKAPAKKAAKKAAPKKS